MYVFYEDDGSFKAGNILSETDASLQVESESGKRSKIKRANTLFNFAAPEPAALMAQATALADTLDLQFLWECAPQEEFDSPVLAADYFGHAPTPVEQAALLMRLHGAPAYFHRRGKGSYRPAPPDILAAALAALEKKQRQAEQQQEWVDEMAAGRLPEPIAQAAESLLIRPDKNSQQWKALDAACAKLGKSPDRLLLELGAWPHALALHKRRFLAVNFPRGLAFPELELPPIDRELPLSDAEIYSVDDVTTTEIDDALSVSTLPDGNLRVGIHVAAPGLTVTRDSEFDKLARARLSTVYMPGDKIPMQPDNVIKAFSLDAGREVPVLSLYVVANPETGEVIESDTRLERVCAREPAPQHARRPGHGRQPERHLHRHALRPLAAPAVEAGAGAVGAARERARQAREQFAGGVQLLPGRQPRRSRHPGAPGAAPAQRAAGPDGGRVHDPGQQPVGRPAEPARRAGHLPLATGRPRAHEHAGAAA